MRLGLLLMLVACSGSKGEGGNKKGGATETDKEPVTTDSETDCEKQPWFADLDGDGFGAGPAIEECEAPESHVADATDCNDDDATVHPGAIEVCGGRDDDCDGAIDDEDDSLTGDITAFLDTDLDGFGGDERSACTLADDEVEVGGDCDDNDALVHPEATDLPCDGVDSDCDPASGPPQIQVPADRPTIQGAIQSASPGHHICVAAGTYNELLTFTGTEGLIVMGEGPDLTVIDALHQETAVVFLDLNGTATSTLQHLTIRNGRATGYTESEGGGLWIGEGQTAILDDVVVASSTATDGGGIGVGFGGSVVLTDVVLRNNYADQYGGGLFHSSWNGTTTMTRVDVLNNSAEDSQWSDGAGVALMDGRHEITDCTFEGNGPTDSGGGLWVGGNARVDVLRSLFTSNVANFRGSAIRSLGTLILNNVEVVANGDPADFGDWLPYGAVSADGTLDATNLIVAGNTSAGVYSSNFTSDASLSLTQATITGNGSVGLVVTQDYGETDLTVVNSIISSNAYGVDINNTDLVAATFRHSVIWGQGDDDFYDEAIDVIGVDGNLSVNPRFTDFSATTDPLTWDLTLDPTSELIDAGHSTILDADGTVSDIGAFGGPGGAAW